MKAKSLKIAATSAAIVLALSGLMYTTLSEGTEYYKHVDEVMAEPEAWHGKKLQLHGYIVDKSIERKRNSLDYRFRVQSNGHVVQATYSGIVPDTFKDGSEVVLKGELGPHGFSVAPDGVMAKCPSKYEAQQRVPTTPGQ
jgi:cytochrome c-type biogenesis protein CcmE